MAATQKPRATAAVRARAEADADRLERISQTLEAAQTDLSSMGEVLAPVCAISGVMSAGCCETPAARW